MDNEQLRICNPAHDGSEIRIEYPAPFHILGFPFQRFLTLYF